MYLKLLLLLTASLVFACSESEPESTPELDASGSGARSRALPPTLLCSFPMVREWGQGHSRHG